MDNELENRIKDAVNKGRTVRSDYYAAIDLPDEQELGAPASEDLIQQLENKIHKPLPGSYRSFLKLFNGWRMVDGSMDLLSISEMVDGPIAESIREWQIQSRQSEDVVAARSVVIGVSKYTPTKLLLDPETPDGLEEWKVIQHHKDEEIVYSSFLEWLEVSIGEFQELILEEDE